MKNNELPLLIGAPVLVVVAIFLWNCDWSGKPPVATGSEPAPEKVTRSRLSNLGSDPTPQPVQEQEAASKAQDGPFAGLTFRNLEDGNALKFDEGKIDAFSFLEGQRVGAIVNVALVQGEYSMMGDGVTIILQEAEIRLTYNLTYNSAEQALLGPNGERYDLKGGSIDLKHTKRTRATKILNDARIYEAAIDQWAIENNKVNSSTFEFSNVSDYIKATHELVRTSGKDILGNAYQIGPVANGVRVNSTSYHHLSDVTRPDFWSSYAPGK